jgi:hypothetical protein
MIQHQKVAMLKNGRFHSLLGTEDESLLHHSSAALFLSSCAEYPMIFLMLYKTISF